MCDSAQGIAMVLKEAFRGAGTDDDALLCATALHSDALRGDAIRRAYAPFGDLAKDIKGDTSGNFEKLLLAMWGQ